MSTNGRALDVNQWKSSGCQPMEELWMFNQWKSSGCQAMAKVFPDVKQW
jgi:hypothetical protein